MLKAGRCDWEVFTYHLLGYHDDGLDRKLPVAVIEKILQAGPEEVDDEDVM